MTALIAVAALLAAAPAAGAAGRSARLDRVERALVRAINHQRAAAGLQPVRASRKLNRAADYHSREMLAGDYFAHSSIDGGAFDARIRRFKRSPAVGETLAMLSRCGRQAARRVIGMWMSSPGHRAIVLSSTFHTVGIGRRTGRLGSSRACVVTADFAR